MNTPSNQFSRQMALIAAEHLTKLLSSPNFDVKNDRHWIAADQLWHGALVARQSARAEAGVA